jgi:hypothetical protein
MRHMLMLVHLGRHRDLLVACSPLDGQLMREYGGALALMHKAHPPPTAWGGL